MSHSVESIAESRQAYGNYILRTGTGVVRDLEMVYGALWYRTRFAGKKPILDLGPGRCWFAKQNLEDIVAVDNAPDLVEHYREQGIKTYLGDAYHVPFSNAYFQGIFCCWLFEHLAEPDRALAELHRVLQPGGYACIIVPSPKDMFAFYDDYTHVRPFTPRSLTQLAEDIGFQRHHVEYLAFTRGVKYAMRLLGSAAAYRYCRFSDAAIRRLGLVNRNHLMLEAWK
jgi:ubiquinone/menaquinone biosynthesis C-methylase UbiE